MINKVIRNKRDEIEFAAEKLFALKGFRVTSIRDIARAADVNSSMISYYFKSKEQLLTELFKRSMLSINRVASDLAVRDMDQLEKIYSLVDLYTNIILEHGQLVYIFLQEQLLKSCPESVGLLGELNSRQYALFNDIVREGIKKGGFRDQVHVPLLFSNLLGTLRFIVIEHHGLTLSEDNPSRIFIKKIMCEANAYLKELLAMQLLPSQSACNYKTCLSTKFNHHEK